MTCMLRGLLAALVLPAAAAALPGRADETPRGAAQAARAEFAPLRADGNGFPAFAAAAPVRLEGVRAEDALRTLAERAGARLTYSAEVPGIDARVTVVGERLTVAEALLRVAEQARLELLVAPAGTMLVVRAAPAADRPRAPLEVRAHDAETGEPVEGVTLEVQGSTARAATDGAGRALLRGAPAGPGIVLARRVGYRPVRIALPAGDEALTLALTRVPLRLAQVVVTPGYYGVMEQRLDAPQAVTREEIETNPQLGDDIFRAVNRLPGVGASDYSAAFRVRGAANQELLVRLDGLELVEPFHLKEMNNALSIVDNATIGGVELMTGGFGARYGNRLTGVFEMRTLDPAGDPPSTTLVLSVTGLRGVSRGSFAGGRGSWLVSGRRGYLDLAFKMTDIRDDISPNFADALAKVEYAVGGRDTVSLHALGAVDRLSYADRQAGEDLNSAYGSGYLWATWRGAPTGALHHTTVLSAGRITWERHGSRFQAREGVRDLWMDEERALDVASLRQDWTLELTPSAMLAWGGEARRMGSEYDYLSWQRTLFARDRQVFARWDTIDVLTAPSGTSLGAHASVRVRPWEPLTAELGVRHDRHSYAPGAPTTPRLNAAWALDRRTTLRGAWGRYSQAQGLHELQVQDGVTRFERTEVAEQRVLGVDRILGRGLSLRLEGYARMVRHPRVRFWNIENLPSGFIPEREIDRQVYSPERARARGVEAFLKRSGERVDWSATYALARAEDREEGRWIPTSLDQRHTFSADASIAPSPKWRLAAAWTYHSGWPYTLAEVQFDSVGASGLLISRSFGPRNAHRLAPYHRLDLRITRRFDLGRTHLSAFLDVFNAYDRRNPRWVFANVYINGRSVSVQREVDGMLPRLPTFGVSWEF